MAAFSQAAFAANPVSDATTAANRLKKSGVSVISCPAFVANPRTGLYTSINAANTLCIKSISGKKATAALKQSTRVRLVLDGKLRGSAFQTLDQQGGNNGDVETGLFNEVNYPVGIFFELENADFSATYTLQIRDGVVGRVEKTTYHGTVPAAGWVDWLGAGLNFFKISALPDKDGNQPIFHVEMHFMDPYEGIPVSASDMKDAGMAKMTCPAYLYDIYGSKRLFTLKGFVCTKRFNPADAGFTAAPYNLTTGLYLAQDVSPANAFGAAQGFPFRVRRPTLMTYQVDDPAIGSGKKGSTDFDVKNLATGVTVNHLHVEGTVEPTETSLNIPGDYYVSVTTRPADRTKYGENAWQLSLEGSD